MRNETIECSGQQVNAFERRVRWTRQTAVLKGLIDKSERSVWSLTDTANSKLANIHRGTVLTFALSETGAFLWANAENALTVIERESVDLLLTSPPYPLMKSKEYGNLPADKCVDWRLSLCEGWADLLMPGTGSMMLNIGPCWRREEPVQELHVERLLVAGWRKNCPDLRKNCPSSFPNRMRQSDPRAEPTLCAECGPNHHFQYGGNPPLLRVIRPQSVKSPPQLSPNDTGSDEEVLLPQPFRKS